MKVKLKGSRKGNKNKKYLKQRPFRLGKGGVKGKMLAYGGRYEDEYGTYKRSDGVEEGKAYTNQITSGVATGVEMGSSFGAVGMAVGAVGGLIGGMAGGGAEVAKMQADQLEAKNREHARREDISKAVLGNYPTKGVAGNHAMYGKGGKIRYGVGGGMQPQGMQPQGVNPQQFQPVASDVNVVDGPGHEEGGVSAGGGNEVEGGEVTNQQDDGSTNVFSDRLEFAKGVTYADAAAEIGKKKGKYEERLESNSIFVKGTARREVEKLDGELQQLFAAQEQKKQEMGIPDPNEVAAQEQQAQQGRQMESEMNQEAQQMAPTQPQGQPQGPGQFAMGGKYDYGSPLGGPNGKPKDTWMTDAYNKRYNNAVLDSQGNLTGNTVGETGDIVMGRASTTNMIDKYRNVKSTVQLNQKKPQLTVEEKAARRNKTGKAISSVAQGLLPYADNLVNAVLTANTPEVPKPKPYRTVPLKTDFNINPQLAGINATEAATAKALKENTKGSGSYRTNLIASRASSVGARNRLYGEKFNKETAMINTNRQNTQRVGMANVDKESQYDMMQLQRKGEIQRRISENVAQATDDAQLQIREQNLMKRDQLELNLLKQQYKDSGVFDRKLQKLFDDYAAGTIDYTAFNAGVQAYKK